MKACRIERFQPHEWERLRELRLRALRDCPEAFGELWTNEVTFDVSVWKGRLSSPDADSFVAVCEETDVGLVTVAPYDDVAGLYSMWVAPEIRGNRVGNLLIDAVIQWARDRKISKVLLDVADKNDPAIALYARKNFIPTGVSGSLPPPRQDIREHQRVLNL